MTIEIQTKSSQPSKTTEISHISFLEATTLITNRTLTKTNIISRCSYRARRDPCNTRMATTATGATNSTCSHSWQISIQKTNESYNHHRYTHSTRRAPRDRSRLMATTATSRCPEEMTPNSPCRNQAFASRARSS